MGTYVLYSLGRSDGIKTAILEHMPNFVRWLHESEKIYPGEYHPSLIALAEKLLREGETAFNVASLHEARLLDDLVGTMAIYDDVEKVSLYHDLMDADVQLSMHKWYRYASDLEQVMPQCSKQASQFYQRLMFGMSLSNFPGHKPDFDRDGYLVGWLLADEVRAFYNELKKINFSELPSNDRVDGIYYLREALARADKDRTSLITEIG